MLTIGANGQQIAYGIKHYNLDTEADLVQLKKRTEPMGSTCFIIETSKYYMLNGQGKWIEITPFGKPVSSGGDTPGGGGEGDDDDHIIYEGGLI